MNVSLTPQLEEWIQSKVEGGKYQTASEVVREALRLCMENDERLRDLRRLAQEGIDDFEAGRYTEWDPKAFKKEARRCIAAKQKERRVG